MSAYYNEIDQSAADWLEKLIDVGEIAPGVVDRRSIEDVEPRDLVGFTQCHFFAGIGGWSLALRRAGVGDDVPVWTGSCPCQPFSSAGSGGGFSDERHLWPAFHHLIRIGRPGLVFGEQVASKSGIEWIGLVRRDLEGEGYLVGAVDSCAASVGAPHIRQRIYWMAHTDGYGRSGQPQSDLSPLERWEAQRRRDLDGRRRHAWASGRLVEGADGARRLCPPRPFPMADGLSGNMVELRGYGNAIVVDQAAEFIQAGLDELAGLPLDLTSTS